MSVFFLLPVFGFTPFCNKEGHCVGMLVLHVDDACYAGHGPDFDKFVERTRKVFKLGMEDEYEFDFSGNGI